MPQHHCGAPRQGLKDCIDYLSDGGELRVACSLIDLRQLVDRILNQ